MSNKLGTEKKNETERICNRVRLSSFTWRLQRAACVLMLQHTAFKELITKAWIQPPSMTTLNRDSLQTDGLEWWFHVVMLKIAKYDFSKDFGFQRSSCCSSCGPQNPCCSSILHKACMVHSMPATRNGKLQHARTIHAKIILTLARTIHAKIVS